MINGNPIVLGGGSVVTSNIIASNIKRGVNVKVGTGSDATKYLDVVGTFEGYVPQAGDIYYNGTWGEGYSATNLGATGFYGYTNPMSGAWIANNLTPSISYNMENALATLNSYNYNNGFFYINRTFDFGSRANSITLQGKTHESNALSLVPFIFITNNLPNSGTSSTAYNKAIDNYNSGMRWASSRFNGINIPSLSYIQYTNGNSIGANTDFTLTLNINANFTGYIYFGMAAPDQTASRWYLKRLSVA